MNLIAIAEVAAVYEALRRSSTVAQQVEDPLLSLLRLGLLLWQGFDSWPGNSPMPWCGQKKKKKKKKKKKPWTAQVILVYSLSTIRWKK